MIAKILRDARPGLGRTIPGVALLGLVGAMSTSAWAVPLTSFKDQGVDHLFGSYAPRGDCAKQPSVTIDEKGMTFRAIGQERRPPRVDYAVSFWGQHYEGIMAVFYPFPLSDSDLGRVLMYVNDDERRGVIRFEADLPRGKAAEPFHAAFTNGGLFTSARAAPLPRLPIRRNRLPRPRCRAWQRSGPILLASSENFPEATPRTISISSIGERLLRH